MNISAFTTGAYVIFSILLVFTVALPDNRKKVLHYMLNRIQGGTWLLATFALLLGYLFIVVSGAG